MALTYEIQCIWMVDKEGECPRPTKGVGQLRETGQGRGGCGNAIQYLVVSSLTFVLLGLVV
jgi:hypothetical protein